MARYSELFSIPDMPGDVRSLNAQQIAAGKKPWFEIRREKAAIYDRLFNMGTTRYLILRVFVYPKAPSEPRTRAQWNAAFEWSIEIYEVIWKTCNRRKKNTRERISSFVVAVLLVILFCC
jgi:hypothetical protein